MSVSGNILEEHVRQSNEIENIFNIRKSHHLFVDHLAAAEFVVKSALELRVVATPEDIHRILMRRETRIGWEILEPGKFRKSVVTWGGRDFKPRPENLEKLMGRWKESLLKDLGTASLAVRLPADKLAWHYHHWFEAIHPFRDGNGRTGRLILNGIRLVFGLPWLIVSADGKQAYFDSIRKWEEEHRDLFETN